MNRKITTALFCYLFFTFGCDLPFLTKATDEELFTLAHDFDGQRIVRETPVTIVWDEVTIEEFKEVLIERAYIDAAGKHWSIVGHVLDSLAVSYTDTIDDDITYQYRVRITNKDGQYSDALSAPFTVPEVTAVIVPDDYSSPQQAFDAYFIDPGDSIIVRAGMYRGNFRFVDKDVSIIAEDGPSSTVLVARQREVIIIPNRPFDIYTAPSVVEINKGFIKGFNIVDGVAFLGGGVYARGTANIIDCVISDNNIINFPNPYLAHTLPGTGGGGVYLADTALLKDCLITGNLGGGIKATGNTAILNCTIKRNIGNSSHGLRIIDGTVLVRNCTITSNTDLCAGSGGGITVSAGASATLINCIINKNTANRRGGLSISAGASATVINCVIYSNISCDGNSSIFSSGSIAILNSIVWNNTDSPGDEFYTQNATYSDVDGVAILYGTGNISVDPLFADPTAGDFHLLPGSPCINSGNPADDYIDLDGSRNDIGAYGGPFGDW